MQWRRDFQRKFSRNRAQHRGATRLFRLSSVGCFNFFGSFEVAAWVLGRLFHQLPLRCRRRPQRKKTARVSERQAWRNAGHGQPAVQSKLQVMNSMPLTHSLETCPWSRFLRHLPVRK